MFKNLINEFEKNNITRVDMADILNISPVVLEEKLSGKKSFRILECLKIQKIVGQGNICLEYLFEIKN